MSDPYLRDLTPNDSEGTRFMVLQRWLAKGGNGTVNGLTDATAQFKALNVATAAGQRGVMGSGATGDTLFTAATPAAAQVAANLTSASPVWQPRGAIITDQTGVAVSQEANVLYEGNSVLLGLSGGTNVFKLWYSGGNTGTTPGVGSSDGIYYAESTNGYENWITIDSFTFTVSTLSAANTTTATLVTSAPHGLATGQYLRIGGASPSQFNGLFRITVVDTVTVTYVMGSSYNGSATGTITCRRGPVTTSTRTSIIKVSGTYYLYAMVARKLFASSDGLTFDTGTALTITGSAGSWEGGGMQNSCVWVEGSNWYMLYEAGGAADHKWQIGLLTSSDGLTWARYSTSPVIPLGDGLLSISGPDVHKVGNVYYCWTHGVSSNTSSATDSVPTDVFRWSSTDLHTWTRSPRYPTMIRSTPDEGVGYQKGQIADVSLIEVDGRTFIFFEGVNGFSLGTTNSSMKVAVANMTLAELVRTNEGSVMSPDFYYTDPFNVAHIRSQVAFGQATGGQIFDQVGIRSFSNWARAVNIYHNGTGGAAVVIDGGNSATCLLSLGAGNTARPPMIIASGSLKTTPVAGAIEYDGTHLYFTDSGGTRHQLSVVA